jgi:ubiquitin-protein ligase
MAYNGSLSRILKDIKMLKEAEDGSYQYYYDESNILIGYALIRGPVGTPYEYGFYLIRFEFSKMYPYVPPACTYINLSGRVVRQSPNFHDNGKVCLSRLNTWDSSDQWLPSYNIQTIITTIQGLVLTSRPCDNEPPYNHSNNLLQAAEYDAVVRFANFRYNVNSMAILEGCTMEETAQHGYLHESIAAQIREYVFNTVRAEWESYHKRLNELVDKEEGRFRNYTFYPNSAIVCHYAEELRRFLSIWPPK